MDSERSIPNPTINKMDFLGRVIGVIKSKEVATKDPFADDTYAKISKSKIGKNRYHPFQKEAVALREDKKRLLEQVEDLKADLEQVQSVCDVLAAEQVAMTELFFTNVSSLIGRGSRCRLQQFLESWHLMVIGFQ